MTSLIDLYLEKLLSKMVVDDVQRVEIEKELRSHLEEAAASAQEKGLTREQAVQEAVLAFGQPSVIARQFGIWWGPGWFYFERIALGALLLFLLGLAVGRTVLDALVCLLLVRSAWNRIEVNGGLLVHRLFRRPLRIPFDLIAHVTLEKGHLFGLRRLRIRFEGRQVVLSAGMRGMSAAGMALETFAGKQVEEKARRYLSRVRLRVREEGPVLKWTMTATWLAIATLAALGWPLLWAGHGFSPYFVAAYGATIPAILMQANRHGDRSKVGLCWLLTVGFVISGGMLALVVLGWAEPLPQNWTVD